METTLIPFAQLPACAQQCGRLYDANGACVPPGTTTAAASVYASCFCANTNVAPFSTGTAGVCDNACAATPADFNSIRNWFTSFCANPATLTGGPAQGGSPATGTTGTGTSTTSGKFTSFPTEQTGDWLSNHWKWVVMLVVMVVGIAGIWIGACIWRRRYLRKKDRQYALGKRLVAGGSTSAGSGTVNNASTRSVHMPSAGLFQAAPISAAGVYGPESETEKRDRRKWNPSART